MRNSIRPFPPIQKPLRILSPPLAPAAPLIFAIEFVPSCSDSLQLQPASKDQLQEPAPAQFSLASTQLRRCSILIGDMDLERKVTRFQRVEGMGRDSSFATIVETCGLTESVDSGGITLLKFSQ